MNDSLPAAARLLSVTGDACLLEGGQPVPVAAGSLLALGQTLSTGHYGTAHLLLASGHELGLGPEQVLHLDMDVLATAAADPSEWQLAAGASAGVVLALLEPGLAPLPLEAVLEPPAASLDVLLGGAGHLPAPAPDAGHGVLADAGMAALLRSLYGPEAWH